MASAFVLAGGLIHYRLWQKTYRFTPDQVPGAWVVKAGFPVNAALSLLLAAGLIAVGYGVMMRFHLPVVVAALALELGSIFLLVMSRWWSIFGWEEKGWDTDAKRTIVVEALAAVTLIGLLVLDALSRRHDQDPTVPA